MVREDTAIILNDDSVVSSFGFEKNLSTITAWVLILLLSYDKSTINTMVEAVNGYGILTDIGTCLNHLKYPVTHNLISYRDYHQSLLLHMHSPLGGIVHAFLYVSIVLNSY